jgi:hypothetical protein
MVLLEASRIVWSEPESAEWPDDGAQPHPVAGREVGDGMSIHKIVERLGGLVVIEEICSFKESFSTTCRVSRV